MPKSFEDAFDVEKHLQEEKRGVRRRRQELKGAVSERDEAGRLGNEAGGLIRSEREMNKFKPGVTRALRAYERQERVARDEPAVEGGDRPSVIRARAAAKAAESETEEYLRRKGRLPGGVDLDETPVERTRRLKRAAL